MSEADRPVPQHPQNSQDSMASSPADPIESIPDVTNLIEQLLNAATSPEDEDWETVNFPNAINIDYLPVAVHLTDHQPEAEQTVVLPAIPQSNEPEPVLIPKEPVPAFATRTMEQETPADLIQVLHESNRDLIHRITQLEGQLEDYQTTVHEQDQLIQQHQQEQQVAKEQVIRLFKKLELSNQVIQQQQVLVEKLTEHWETGQTQLAQMERDCALTQQRYQEQSQELLQTHTLCRELRSRLHRQQRYTLQFKAALERCLEMQSQAEETGQKPENLTRSALLDPSKLDIPKASPVQPWSSQFLNLTQTPKSVEEISEVDSEEILISKAETDPVKSPDLLQQTPLISSPITQASLSENPVKQQTDETVPPSPLITSEQDLIKDEWPKPRFLEEELDRIRQEYASMGLENLDFFNPENGTVEPNLKEENPFVVADSDVLNVEPELVGVGKKSEVSTPPTLTHSANWPAPLIHPQRQQKLPSLAAIKLPSFPKDELLLDF